MIWGYHYCWNHPYSVLQILQMIEWFLWMWFLVGRLAKLFLFKHPATSDVLLILRRHPPPLTGLNKLFLYVLPLFPSRCDFETNLDLCVLHVCFISGNTYIDIWYMYQVIHDDLFDPQTLGWSPTTILKSHVFTTKRSQRIARYIYLYQDLPRGAN